VRIAPQFEPGRGFLARTHFLEIPLFVQRGPRRREHREKEKRGLPLTGLRRLAQEISQQVHTRSVPSHIRDHREPAARPRLREIDFVGRPKLVRRRPPGSVPEAATVLHQKPQPATSRVMNEFPARPVGQRQPGGVTLSFRRCGVEQAAEERLIVQPLDPAPVSRMFGEVTCTFFVLEAVSE